ncbi:SGNH/GDSL hydrolase family protein [[Phormidium] sp. LEGE 05292]|uniref:SGNH/GDSL hydrolase family protein n=1 Tax=[Phormidium] sp. LEGE 05292 TaxID=767427 RepID=UPI001D145BEF|nr:SGNH/GDSL hydrolase family protein [Phormidium sp. LEGE 05292]
MILQKLFVAGASVAIAFTPILNSAALAAGLSYSKMYVFGDSLSDTGNVYNSSTQQFPPPPYYKGRFSNGLNWVDYLAQDLGLTPTTFITQQGTQLPFSEIPTQSINFAFGGATTGIDNTVSQTAPGLQQEVGAYLGSLQATNQTADPNALYILWAGANDYLPTDSTWFTPFKTPNQTINNISFALDSLLKAGAKQIAVANLPNLGELPKTLGTPGETDLKNLAQAHNLALGQTINSLSQSYNAKIVSLDFASLFADVINNPGNYNLTNVTQGCLLVQCQNPNQFLFWDDIHPTTKGHQLLADKAYSTLSTSVPEPGEELGLLLLGLLGAASIYKRKKFSGSLALADKMETVSSKSN